MNLAHADSHSITQIMPTMATTASMIGMIDSARSRIGQARRKETPPRPLLGPVPPGRRHTFRIGS